MSRDDPDARTGTGAELPVSRLTPLSPSSGVPRYRQIADQIAALLTELGAGVRLPSEHEIASHLAVSRATSTQALRELQSRGLVSRIQGRGTFSSGPPAVRTAAAQRLPSFSDDLRRAGHTTGERVLRCERAPASSAGDAAPVRLGVSGDALLWRVERVIVSDSVPVAHVTSWLPERRYPRMDADAVGSGSLYEYLERTYGADARPDRADEEWAAVQAPRETAKLLELPRHAPVMRVFRLAMLGGGEPAEYGVSYVRGDSFVVALRVSADAGLRLSPRLRTEPSA
ncbi:GntR family transcriptional regulator [Jiangella aurantiaca]|uniref:GntR family transcriptional regulator n=1 Tax=Jiangella aurantiaca TaxID=2530373 RepID=A0A4R5AHT5_9ACTN|nr:GntR family transcriptional regulator [Jiangella aurantiaca]TDD71255.1 GntR family transcriptional regulator [Jiangella aurantiaca]